MRTGSTTTDIQITDVKEWFSALALPMVDVIAINCEGGEYEILPRILELGLATRFVNILVQFHLLGESAHAKRDEIRNQLRQTHDEVFSYPFVWELWRLR
jgi:hypothetical protein